MGASKVKKVVSYVATGRGELAYHKYSAKYHNAVSLAIDCAKHWVMRGEVYAIFDNGQRQLVWKPEFEKK